MNQRLNYVFLPESRFCPEQETPLEEESREDSEQQRQGIQHSLQPHEEQQQCQVVLQSRRGEQGHQVH